VNSKSVTSIDISIINIEMNDIPKAVERALLKSIWLRIRIAVSSMTLVARQLIRVRIANKYHKLEYITRSAVNPENE
jgi:hypothetical protein